MTYSALIRSLRGTRSQEEFGRLIGVDGTQILRHEKGRTMPSGVALAALLRAFPDRRDEIIDALAPAEVTDQDGALDASDLGGAEVVEAATEVGGDLLIAS